jgi:hypothetical protein
MKGCLISRFSKEVMNGRMLDYERFFQRSLGLGKGITYWKESGL